MGRQRYLLDAVDVGRNEKGITRVIVSLVPHLLAEFGDDLLVVCTAEGATMLDVPPGQVVQVPSSSQAVWEQVGLPRIARRVGATAVYSHRECGALWGPPLVLHVPEDPEVRWAREPVWSARERARRAYSRVLMRRALRRAAVVGASVPSISKGLERRFSLREVRTLPLGIAINLFRPTATPSADTIFHLGSSDPRDRTMLVLDAYELLLKGPDRIPPLVLAGNLGPALTQRIAERSVGISDRVRVPGRVTDEDLAAHYRNAAVVIQPSSDEGFGLQPLEALASGAPLVTTATPAVADVVGDAAVTAPATADGLSQAMREIMRDQELTERLRTAGSARAKLFSWQNSAALIAAALKDAAQAAQSI